MDEKLLILTLVLVLLLVLSFILAVIFLNISQTKPFRKMSKEDENQCYSNLTDEKRGKNNGK